MWTRLRNRDQVTVGSAVRVGILTEHVGLVHNLCLDQFLYNILQRNEPDRFVKRITFTLAVHPVHESHVSLVTCNDTRGNSNDGEKSDVRTYLP